MPDSWNAQLYESSHSFVWKFGRDLLALLEPRPGERILDVGSGTGQLTAEIAASGAQVVGIDSAASMIDQSRKNFPELQFEHLSVTDIPYNGEFDAVFSNATLHWVRDADLAAARISRALKPGGRFVAEFGGRGNTGALVAAVYRELELFGVPDPQCLNPWYYPRVGKYATLLEQHSLEVTFAALFDRPTPLEGGEAGLRNWMTMFAGRFLDAVDPQQREQFITRVEERAAPCLKRDDGWTMDYRRIRVRAVKY